ncbi:Arginyl tRNA synthetase [Paragonimus kellicotti]|nr:Arginyl tRNA synthetase [Paragonimus kellicotti]
MRYPNLRPFRRLAESLYYKRDLTSGVFSKDNEGFTRSLYCKPETREVLRNGKSVKIFTGLVDSSAEPMGDQFVTLQMKLTYKHDLDFTALRRWVHEKVKQRNRLRQIISNHTIEHLGLDLAVAHMVCNIGGRVQFVGSDKWFFRFAGLPPELPHEYVGDLRLQSIDLSGTNVVYEGFELLPQLRELQFLRLRRCLHVDDFCMSRVGRISSLMLLDVGECPRLTSKGLATLTQLKNLRHLLVHNNPLMEDKELVCLLLEDHLPKLFIDGVNYLGELPRESQRSIIALITGEAASVDCKDNAQQSPDQTVEAGLVEQREVTSEIQEYKRISA